MSEESYTHKRPEPTTNPPTRRTGGYTPRTEITQLNPPTGGSNVMTKAPETYRCECGNLDCQDNSLTEAMLDRRDELEKRYGVGAEIYVVACGRDESLSSYVVDEWEGVLFWLSTV